MNGNGFDNNPFDDDSDYLFKIVTKNGRRKTYGWSLAAMISGIFSVVFCFTGYAGLIFGVLAIVFAIISRKNLGYFDGRATLGLILGIIGFVLSLALIIATYTMDADLIKYITEYIEEYQKTIPDTDTKGPGV